ncbi:MAG: Fur family transcriptional regulator [Chloroflexi bacterium]|nr:Fur family transcriptional regulator [Chloroflexota bacterium]
MTTQLTHISELIQTQGYRLTAAREAIITALVQTGGHISADELVEIVHQAAPQVGRMTVYRTLDLLCELGCLRPVYQGTGAAHYILFADGHHHHLVCRLCEKVVEFDECLLRELEERIGRRFNFAIEGHLLELYGLCGDCQGRDAVG